MGLKEYIWKGSFLGWFVGLGVPVQEIFVLPCQLYTAQYKIYFPHHTIFHFMCPHHPASLAGSCAESLARNYRPSFRENKPKTLFLNEWIRAFWACFHENAVYKFGHLSLCLKQRHILRGRRHSTTACPACWAMQTCEVKYYSEEKLFCTGRTRARQDKSL